MPRVNQYDQPIGDPVDGWQPRPAPGGVTLQGRTCRLEPFSVERHAHDLYHAYRQAPDGRDWTYLFVGPFERFEDYQAYAQSIALSLDPRHYAVVEQASGKAVGTLSLMRIDPAHGAIEVGNVTFSPRLKQSILSTEAQYLLMAYALGTLGYRRYEWKCDSLNAPSRRAAERMGFRYEGTFRRAVVYKGRSRDTAWYSVVDEDWPQVRASFEAWLAPSNFDASGQQLNSLAAYRATLTP